MEERSREKTRQQAKSSRLKAGWRGVIDEGKLPKGDGTQLLAGAAMSSTCRAAMCAQPRTLPGHDRDSAGAMGTLQRGSKVPQLPQESCVEFQGRGKGRDHRVLPALAVLNPKFLWCSALAGS